MRLIRFEQFSPIEATTIRISGGAASTISRNLHRRDSGGRTRKKLVVITGLFMSGFEGKNRLPRFPYFYAKGRSGRFKRSESFYRI